MKQAMIFAAGLGTRLKPITDTKPKALVEVGGQPLLRHVIMRLHDADFCKIVVNVHHFADMVKDYIYRNSSFNMDITISDESGMLLDTGGGLKKAAGLFDLRMPVLVHNVDILSNVDLGRFYDSCHDCDALLLVSRRKTNRYLIFSSNMRLVGWTNVATGEIRTPYKELDMSKCQLYAFSGIHIVTSQIFSKMDLFPDKFGIMDFYISHCAEMSICAYVKEDLQLLDVGKTDALQRAEELFRSGKF